MAWQGPGLEQAVIEFPYLTPWQATGDVTNGILREYWTNFAAGDLEGLAGPREFESALAVEAVHVSFSGPGELPKPDPLALDQPLPAAKDYRWVRAEGLVKFAGADGDVTFLELSDGQAVVQVRALHCAPEMSRRLRNVPVRVEGVCEGVSIQNGQDRTLAPGLIWASAENSISFIETAATNAAITAKEIASRLRLSVRTVDNHRQHICNKLKLHGTHSLLKFAFDHSAYL